MALSINSKGTIPLGNVAGTTFTAKLQNAGSSATYPEGTVFDCSGYKTETITSTVTIRRAGITFLFGEGDFTMSVPNQNMFDIQVPNVTIIGVSRSARDSSSTNGSTRFVMTNTSGGYHIVSTPTSSNAWTSSDSMTIMNVDLVGVKSTYTSSSGTPTFSVQGAGGIMINEGNPDASGSNLNNIWINEVLIEGARRHGIMIYGGMASKIQNTRVRNAGGHGFYIAGSTTSTNLDTCYASGCYLAGFALHNTSYSTLNNCASDSNGLGYWMRNANAITMSSCGAEACEVRSSIPFNLGITLPSQAGTVTINDIGSDNVNYIKGSSFLFTGGSNITGTSCYSKDPGNRAGQATFVSKFTAHIYAENGTEKVNMDNFLTAGDSPVKYIYRLGDVYNFTIDAFIDTYDPLNPSESPDGTMTPIAEVLDAGAGNVFGDLSNAWSFIGRRNMVVNPTDNFRINQLQVETRMSIPTYNAHPAEPQAGTVYFNTTLNKLYIFSGSGWYDTCCATAPTPAPECIFPNGGVQTAASINSSTASGLGLTGGGSPLSFIRRADKFYLATTAGAGIHPVIWTYDINTSSLSYLLTLNDIINIVNPLYVNAYPNGNNSTGANSSTFSPATESIYIAGAFFGDPDLENSRIGGSTYILKYNIVTNEIDATNIISDLDASQVADGYNSRDQAQLFVANNKLYVVKAGNNTLTQGTNFIITTYDLNDLALIDYYTGASSTNIGSGYSIFNIDVNTNMLANGNKVIFTGYTQPVDPSGSFVTLFDLTDGSYEKFYYDSTPITETVLNAQTISASESGNTFFIADANQQNVYEIEYNGLTIINTWNLGYVGNIGEKVVNGKRLLFYVRNIPIANGSHGIYYACYNVTDDLYIGQLGINNGEPAICNADISTCNVKSVSASLIPINGDPSDNIFIFESSSAVKKLCAPYTV